MTRMTILVVCILIMMHHSSSGVHAAVARVKGVQPVIVMGSVTLTAVESTLTLAGSLALNTTLDANATITATNIYATSGADIQGSLPSLARLTKWTPDATTSVGACLSWCGLETTPACYGASLVSEQATYSPTTDRFGVSGGAYLVTSDLVVSYYIDVTSSTYSVDTDGAITWAAWIKPMEYTASPTAYRPIAGVYGQDLSVQTFIFDVSPSGQLRCGVYDAASAAWMDASVTSADNSSSVANDEWSHVACRVSKRRIDIFVNGRQAATRYYSTMTTFAIFGPSWNYRANWFAGMRDTGTPLTFNGALDDFSIWLGGRLDAKRIARLAADNQPSSPLTAAGFTLPY